MVVSRFDVYLVDLDPTQGHEIGKTRPWGLESACPPDRPRRLETPRTFLIAGAGT